MAFSVVLFINAIDESTNVVGNIRVSGAEGEARTADFSINPAAGNIDPYAYIGQTVTIDYVDGSTDRLFTGIVHLPVYDINSGLLSFVCTDNLQEAVELITRSAIDALLPGSWDESVFNDPEENWSYSQQIMSTYPGSFDKDVNGATRVTDWLPKVTEDLSYTDSIIINDTLTVTLSERRSIINSIKIAFSNRYQRLWQRELQGTWDLGLTWFTYLSDPVDLPTKSMVTQAASGWTEKLITFTDLPPSGDFSGIFWILSDYAKSLCQGASIEVARRWVQNITDNYTITLQSAASVTQHGLLEVEQKHTLSAETPEDFNDFSDYKSPQGVSVATGNFIDLTAASPNSAITTAMDLAKTRILASHRNNKIAFQCALNPVLDMDKTVRVNHTKAVAKGKVFSITHDIDLINGSAISTCEISVYMPNIASQTDDSLTVPASPYTNPTGMPTSLPTLSNHFGNVDLAPVDDPTWNGWIANFENWAGMPPPPEFYNVRFSFEIPAATETDAVEFNGSSSFNIAIPQDEMVIIK